MSYLVGVSLIALALLILVHVVTPSLKFLKGTPRSIWLSIGGGVSVPSVFVHFIPELTASREAVAEAAHELGLADRQVVLLALLELAGFRYGVWKKRHAAANPKSSDQ